MDRRHRVYYLVNLNQNHTKQGWWSAGWDSYGIVYDRNLGTLKKAVHSLKIMPSRLDYRSEYYYQMKISCKWEEEQTLLNVLDKMRLVNYMKIREED